MKTLWRFAPWINRLVLLAATFIFAMVGLRYIINPVQAAAATDVSLNSPLAATVTRVGAGAFPLGFAIFTCACLIATRRLLTGVSLVAVVITTAIVVRIFGTVADGPASESIKLFIPEGVILTLALVGMLLEAVRRQKQSTAPL